MKDEGKMMTGPLEQLWQEVLEAIGDAYMNGEGRLSVWYLEHHFNKAGLGVYRLPDAPPEKDAIDACRAINPTNPQLVAEAIVEMWELLTDYVTGDGSPGDETYARSRALLARITAKTEGK